ncbi:hypothetical protein Tco_0425600 [Tanacetum coccineum]
MKSIRLEQPAQPRRVEQENYANDTLESRKIIDAEAEAIHMILNGIGDDIYSIVDSYSTARKMWLAIEHLQQGESINKQDVKTKLFWEFGKFTSRDGGSIKSYYSRCYKMMNKIVRSKLEVDTMQVNYLVSTTTSTRMVKGQRDKDMQKNLSLISKYIKNIYKPTNNSLRTSSNTGNKNVDTSPKNRNDNQTGQFVNQRAGTVVRARETVGNQAKDYEYHKEKMMLCKQESKGVPLSAEQEDWLHDTNDEPDDHELEAHYMYMAKIQEHSEQPESINDTYVVETIDSNVTPDSSYMCDNEGQADQNAKNTKDERVFLASLISNFKLDLDANKIPKAIKESKHVDHSRA